MIGSVEVRVRYSETDQMGRAHHRNYLVWCELGRTSLMRDNGVSYAEMERSGVMLPVARAEVEYRGAVVYDEVVRIETWVERVRSRDIVFAYRMTRGEDGSLVALAWTTLVCADDTGRPVRLPQETRDGSRRVGHRRRRGGRVSAVKFLLAVPGVVLLTGCASGLTRGEPLTDPSAIAATATSRTGADGPVRVVFEWEYADERGNLRGEGASRVNPPDRFRLDLFSTAEGSMQAVLVDDELTVRGEIEDVQFPPATFLYAMTGVFRPGAVEPLEGFRSGAFEVLGYPAEGDAMRYFYLLNGRLQRVEERRDGRMQRRIVLEWGDDPTWPREARYRDDTIPNVVRWELIRVAPQTERWPESIYEIDPVP